MREWIDVAPDLRITGSGGAWIVSAATLVLADLHIGYARAARRRGGWLPAIESSDRLATRVLAAMEAVKASRLVIAGDLRHSTRDVDALELAEVDAVLDALRERHDVLVVAGNHDRGSDYARSVVIGAFDVTHEPPDVLPARWTICGHVHPTTTIRDATGAAVRYPCALVGNRTVVLPAFSEWAGGVRGRRLFERLPGAEWQRYVIASNRVVDADALTR